MQVIVEHKHVLPINYNFEHDENDDALLYLQVVLIARSCADKAKR